MLTEDLNKATPFCLQFPFAFFYSLSKLLSLPGARLLAVHSAPALAHNYSLFLRRESLSDMAYPPPSLLISVLPSDSFFFRAPGFTLRVVRFA